MIDSGMSQDFREFCFAVWNFCTLSKTDLVTFVHHIYSSSISNASASEALKAIVIDVYGKEKLKSVFLRDLLAKIEKISDPVSCVLCPPTITHHSHMQSLQREHFIRFVEKNGALLFPAWDVQRQASLATCWRLRSSSPAQMRDKVIGKSFWNKATKRREQSHNKLYRPTMFEQLYEMLVRTDGEHQRREEAGERQPKKKGKKAAAIQPMQILAVSG